MKIDRRKSYYLVLDTETANGYIDENNKLCLDDSLFYDCGFAVIDKKGNVYETHSYVNYDIFCGMADVMKSAYYKEKIPKYYDDLKRGDRKWSNTIGIRKVIKEACNKYNVKSIICHNARFDNNTLNKTIRYITGSKVRYFLPYGVEIWDSLKMSRDVILKMPSYKKYADKHNLKTATGKLSATAENLYRFITKNPDFIESHTGLEDVLIEKEIFAYCMKQHKKMRKKLFEN